MHVVGVGIAKWMQALPSGTWQDMPEDLDEQIKALFSPEKSEAGGLQFLLTD